MDDSVKNCSKSLSNYTTLQVLIELVPYDDSYSGWSRRSPTWFAFYYILIIIYCFLFISLSITCAILLSKKHLAQRFKVRTFIAIDLALIVLGVSRTLFLLLDPWGQAGYCTHIVCIVLSRLFGSMAFPSLTASYTLVFITLWISVRIHLGRSWLQNLKILIPLCCVHYIVALIIEIIVLLPFRNTMVVLFLLVGCEVIFSLWGFIVCFMFLIAGYRLLKTVEKSAKSSSVICRDSPNMNRHDLIEKSKFKNRADDPNQRKRSLTIIRLKNHLRTKQRRAERKITAITYITMVLGMLYSILNIANLIISFLILFDGCLGELIGNESSPDVWLAIRYFYFTLEISLAVFLTYATNDYTPLIDCVVTAVGTCCRTKEFIQRFSLNVQDNSTISKNTLKVDIETCVTRDENSTISINDDDSTPPVVKNNSRISKSPSPLSVSFDIKDNFTGEET